MRISSKTHGSTRRARGTVRLVAATLLLLPALSAGAAEPIGPGVAGQIHALAYDPTTPGTIYAGGDNCGVYITEDWEINWERWNHGLADDNPRKTSYVDDLLAIDTIPGMDESAAGVYAATRGGIAFSPFGPIASWDVQTEGENYTTGYARGVGAAIPFACLLHDPTRHLLFAGAGNGRIIQRVRNTMYPESGASDEYSLWKKNIASDEPGDWEPVSEFSNHGPVFQMAIVDDPAGVSRVAIATSHGIFLEDATGTGWTCIFGGSPEQPHLWRNTVGMGVGNSGRIYALTRPSSHYGSGMYQSTPATDMDNHYYYHT